MRSKAVFILLAMVAAIMAATPAGATRFVPAVPPIPGAPQEIRLDSLRVEATVEEGVAKVRLDQVFVNQGRAPAEGTYLFPLPTGASLSTFQMFVDGQAYGGEVLNADQARAVYESIVRQNRDPALLQYVGQGLLQARVFPIPPGKERTIRVEYEQVLPKDGGLWELAVPLDREAIPKASINVNIKGLGNGSLYSPTHSVAITRRGDGSAGASFEGTDVRGDFRLFFGKPNSELGVSLLSYKSGSEDAYFLLLVNPPDQQQAEVVAKDVILVIDLSGSMAGAKFEQAKAAALQILGSLGRDDRFAVVGFHSDTVTYADQLQGAASAADAMEYVRGLQLGGATNIDGAMERAQQIAGKAAGRPQVIILLTDGQPTSGETDPGRIVEGVRSRSSGSQRIFTFGVGYDVNAVLLDNMAAENRGRSDYVKPEENLESAVATFWRKIGQPVLADVSLEWDGVKVEEVYPRPVPDLYLGSQMVLAGRYRKGATASLTINGTVNGATRTYRFDSLKFTEKDSARDYIPRLWANRKVGWLLTEIRRTGTNQELVDEVVKLSQRFGIVTPYTSFFVPEPTPTTTPVPPAQGAPRTTAPGTAMKESSVAAADAMAKAPAAGQKAVEAARQVGELKDAESLSKADSGASSSVQTAGDKTFVLQNGIWTDTAYQGQNLIHLKLGSDKYWELVRLRADLARYLAVGSPLILVDDGQVYGIDIPGQEESAVNIKAAAASDSSGGGSGLGAWPVLLGGAAGAAVLALWLRRRRNQAA